MCFISSLSLTASELKSHFKADFELERLWIPASEISGFTHPKTPILTHDRPHQIQLFEWGLLPIWAKDKRFQNNTLNARMETLHEKPSFRKTLVQRCLIPSTGFYDWHWLDEQGKEKQKYFITAEHNDVFTFAGLWNTWTDPDTMERVDTYTIITRPAIGLMAEIHNSKQRMPWMLPQAFESDWLNGKEVTSFDVPTQAMPINS